MFAVWHLKPEIRMHTSKKTFNTDTKAIVNQSFYLCHWNEIWKAMSNDIFCTQ